MLFKEEGQPFVNGGLDLALHFYIAQFAFSLTFKLWLGEFNTDDCRQSFPHILASEVGVVFLDVFVLLGEIVKNTGQSRAEAGYVGTAVDSINAVSEAECRLVEAVVILHGYLNLGTVDCLVYIDGDRMADGPVAVEVADKTGYTAFKVERPFGILRLVSE